MEINANFSQAVVITAQDHHWVPSPINGVERMMLDRIGTETGHATSLIRYAPNSNFPKHVHDGGEEILVLEGLFSDEHDDYPKGSYLCNPIGSSHQPKVGKEGALHLLNCINSIHKIQNNLISPLASSNGCQA